MKKALCLALVMSLMLSSAAAAQVSMPPLKFAGIQQKDWYYEGQSIAEREYSGGGAVVGGLISGFGLGLIGWGIGYAVVANMGADVPQHYVRTLPTADRQQFKDGYTSKVKQTRKGKFNIGAAIGTLTAVTLFLLSAE